MNSITLTITLALQQQQSIIQFSSMSNEGQLQASHIGINDYILNHTQEQILIAQINNIIKKATSNNTKTNSDKIKNRIKTINEQSKDKTLENITKNDIQWLKKVDAIILAEMTNSKYTVDNLAAHLNISRSKVHRQIKRITGITPNKYFREIKLQKARSILENGTVYTVNEVCYAVGFDTPKYFSKIYEARFGKRPISYFRTN